MLRSLILFLATSCIAASAATDVTLPDTLRLGPQDRVRVPVIGKLLKFGQIEASIRFTPGVVRVADVTGDQAHAFTCASFGVLNSKITRDSAVIDVICGSSGAGVHDTLFALILDGVYSVDTQGVLEIAALRLDGELLETNSTTCVILRDGGQVGTLTSPTQITGNYPNPFSTTTRLSFSVESAQTVTINVRTIQGRLVRTFSDIPAQIGENETTLSFMESDIGSGRYIVELITKEKVVYHGIAVMR